LSELNTQQLATARAIAWHQNGEGLLTLEAAAEWVHRYGLVLFAPRAQQIPAAAPTFVEAVLGSAKAAPTVEEIVQARAMLARLTAEGAVVPLNLLGAVSDVPDFVVSAKVFSFVFTLRGDKDWKHAPSTSGVVKVSQLAVATYSLLAEHGVASVTALAHGLGREVTEAAVLRALCELWGHLRVLPVAGGEWELVGKRFTKQVKAGINAGQPTALSALISLYLAQAIAATEEEAEVFLSPLAARSRIREVLHALMATRQLESVVLEGKTLLHVAGDLPEFAPEPVAAEAVTDEAGLELAAAAENAAAEVAVSAPVAQPRIRKFAPARPERERRPFKREGSAKPSFTKPWEESKRPAAGGEAEARTPKYLKKTDGGWVPTRKFGDEPRPERAAGGESEVRPPRKPFGDRPPRKAFGDRPKFGGKPRFGDKPKFGDRPPRKSFGGDSDSRPPRRAFGDKPAFGGKPKFGDKPFRPRPSGDGEGRPPRKSFGDKPAFGGKPKFGDRPFRPRPSGDGEGRPPRKSFGDRPAFGDRPKFGGKPKFGDKPFRPKPSGDGEGRPPRRSFGDKPAFGGKPKFGDRPFRPRPSGDGEGRPPRKSFGDKPFRPRPSGDGEGFKPRRKFEGDGERKPFRKFDSAPGAAPAEGGDRPFKRPFTPGGKKFGGKPGGGFKKFSGGKPFGGPKKFGGKKPGGGPRKGGSGA